MNLDDAQKKLVSNWIAEGLKLSDIQKRLVSDLGVNMTYMELRFLLDDLALTPKDTPKAAAPPSPLAAPGSAVMPGAKPGTPPTAAPAGSAAPRGGVSVTVDELARADAVVSGKVNFSDGMSAEWYLDQYGRLGLAPTQAGYKPSAEDLRDFQTELHTELRRLGFT